MKKALTFVAVSLLPFLATSCESTSYAQHQNTTNGALIGTVLGGVIGHQSGHALEGAAIGAAVGGLTGHATTPPQPYHPPNTHSESRPPGYGQ